MRVRARTKGAELGVASDCDQNVSLHGQFSAPVKKSKEEEEEEQDYYLNMGYAIRTLREEFPELFYRELNFDIYRFELVDRSWCLWILFGGLASRGMNLRDCAGAVVEKFWFFRRCLAYLN